VLDAYLYDGLRTPFGRHAGALAPVRPDDLAAGVMRALLARAPWKAGERDVLLHDTAGLRKKARVAGETLEEMSVASTLEAIRFADCVVVMIDANAPFEKQDLTIADLIAREGRAIVFALNKWDLLENKAGAISRMREKLDRLLPQVAGAPLIATSARTGEGLERLEAEVKPATAGQPSSQ
jgi:GTP-binding protein